MPVTEKVAAAREDIARKLLELFRNRGFDGVSLADIAQVTGLGRSSLYHYFPGGKEQMAQAVMDLVGEWNTAHLVEPLRAAGDRKQRIDAMLDALEKLYDGGEKPCVVASMLLGATPEPVAAGAHGALLAWIDALTDALTATGAAPQPARAAALDAVIRIQGSLIVARAIGTCDPFRTTLDGVRDALLAV